MLPFILNVRSIGPTHKAEAIRKGLTRHSESAILHYMNGHNAHQKILDLLASQEAPLTKATIINQTNLSEPTINEACTDLRRAGLVQVTNGHWSITPEGKEQHERNPNFSPTFLRRAKTPSRENWAEQVLEEIGLDFIQSSVVCEFFYTQRPEELNQLLKEHLKLFTFAWLVQYLPAFQLEFEINHDLDTRDNQVMEAFRTIISMIEGKIEKAPEYDDGLEEGFEYIRGKGGTILKDSDGQPMIRRKNED